MLDTFQVWMAQRNRTHWSEKDLVSALTAIQQDNISLRAAEDKYGIPKSTISHYLHGKSEIGTKPGPSSILTSEEEAKLVEYMLHMAEIGYGRTKPTASR